MMRTTQQKVDENNEPVWETDEEGNEIVDEDESQANTEYGANGQAN